MQGKSTCQNYHQIRLSHLLCSVPEEMLPCEPCLKLLPSPKMLWGYFCRKSNWMATKSLPEIKIFQHSTAQHSSISATTAPKSSRYPGQVMGTALLRAGHTHSCLILCLGCMQSHGWKSLTTVTWEKSTPIHCQRQICCKLREMGDDNPWWCHLTGMTPRELVPGPARFPPGFCGCRHWSAG